MTIYTKSQVLWIHILISCFVVMRYWLILTIYVGATALDCGNFKHIPISGKQPWRIWVNSLLLMDKDSKTKHKESCISWDWKWRGSCNLNQSSVHLSKSFWGILFKRNDFYDYYYHFYHYLHHHQQQQQQHHLTQHWPIFIWLGPSYDVTTLSKE